MKHDKTLIARVDEKTLKNIDNIKDALDLHSSAEAVRRSLSICNKLISCLKKGDKIMLVSKNGSKRELIID